MADAGVIELVDTLEAMDFGVPCEHSQHRHQPRRHNGNAEWIQVDAECTCALRTILVCTAWRDYVTSHGHEYFHCFGCAHAIRGNDITFTRI